VTSRLGWRTEFPWERYERWAVRTPSVRLVENRPIPPLGHFSLVRYVKLPSHAAENPMPVPAERHA
jgi:phosphatidylethanolamine/phosphatidyl-N-methylethanolamine N-methyltransferase